MQIGKDTTIRLMIVDDSGEDAEAVVSAFRNGGIAIRPHRPLNAAELASMLATQSIDLVLAADDDWQTEGNPGLTAATEAARAVGGRLAVPDFAAGAFFSRSFALFDGA